ncbi:MAG: hypothetical protein ACR2Q4_13255 [Geminicoccaceae bacterium]
MTARVEVRLESETTTTFNPHGLAVCCYVARPEKGWVSGFWNGHSG